MGSSGGTAVEHSPHHPKVKGSSLTTVAGMGRENGGKTHVRFLKLPPKLPPGVFPAATRTASLAALVATKEASWPSVIKLFYGRNL